MLVEFPYTRYRHGQLGKCLDEEMVDTPAVKPPIMKMKIMRSPVLASARLFLPKWLTRCQLVYRIPVFCSVFYTPDPYRVADRRTSPTTIQLHQPYYSAILEYNYVF